jgi:hypothetical protein
MVATFVSHLLRMMVFSVGGLRSRGLHDRARTELAVLRGITGAATEHARLSTPGLADPPSPRGGGK